MRLLVDAQLPPALARWFGERGIAAMAVRQLGLRDSDDGSIWNLASGRGVRNRTEREPAVANLLAAPLSETVVTPRWQCGRKSDGDLAELKRHFCRVG